MAHKNMMISLLRFDNQRITCLRVNPTPKGLDVHAYCQKQGAWRSDDDSLQNALREFVAEHDLEKDTLCTILPRHEITTRILELPTHDIEEAASMIRLNAEEYVPYGVDELIIAQSVVRKLPSGNALVLAALAHRDVVEKHVAVLHDAGLEPQKILLSSACIASAAMAAHRDGAGERAPETQEQRYALVDLASGGIEALVMEAGHLRYNRGVATNQDWTLTGEQAADALEEMAMEVRGTLSVYRRESEDGLGVDDVYLCSEWADVSSACEGLAAETGKECAPADFLKALVTQGAEKLETLPAASLGAALAAQDRAAISIDLLPDDLRRKQRMAGLQRHFLYASLAALLILASLGGLYAQAIWQRKDLLQGLQREAAEIGPKARGIANKQEQLQILRNQVDRSGSALECLAAVTEAAPEGAATVTRFSFDRILGIDIWGRAKTVDDVNTFAQNLRALAERSGLEKFAAARRAYEQKGRERNKVVFDFQISIPFEEEEDVAETITSFD